MLEGWAWVRASPLFSVAFTQRPLVPVLQVALGGLQRGVVYRSGGQDGGGGGGSNGAATAFLHILQHG